MIKNAALVFSAIFILLLAVLIIRFVSRKPLNQKEISVGSAVFKADVADTDMSRMLGLSGRKNLGEDEGMLFIFPIPGVYTFWMKGMNFPLDFVWISNGSVIQVMENVPKPTSTLDFATYSPVAPVDRVLEINAGAVARTGIQVGDSVQVK
jgi:uncharacterized membrane protein (UPF0127 family)